VILLLITLYLLATLAFALSTALPPFRQLMGGIVGDDASGGFEQLFARWRDVTRTP
jgi:hypothetical protein